MRPDRGFGSHCETGPDRGFWAEGRDRTGPHRFWRPVPTEKKIGEHFIFGKGG